MHRGLQLLGRIGDGGEGEGALPHPQAQRPAAGEVQPHRPGVHMAAALLGHQVGGHMGGLLVPSVDAALLPVWVRLPGEAQPPGPLHGRRCLESQAEERELGASGPALIAGGDGHAARALHPVEDLCLQSRHGGRGVDVPDADGIGALLQDPGIAAPLPGVRSGPHGALPGEAAAHVIFRGSPPVSRTGGPPQPLPAPGNQGHRPAVLVGEKDLEALPLHAQGPVPVDNAQGRRPPPVRQAQVRLRTAVGRVVPGPGLRSGVPVADILHGGLLRAVGKDDAVGGEGVVALPLAEVAAVAQNPASGAVHAPEGLVHVVPDEPALVLGELLLQTDIALHAAQAVAHVVHVLAEEEGLLRPALQVGPDGLRGGVHAALHVGTAIEAGAVFHALVVDHPAGVVLPEKVCHGEDVLPGVGLVAAGPEEDGRMVLVPLEHTAGPVHDALLPLRQTPGHIPIRVDAPQPLPGPVALQVGLVHDVDAVFVAEAIPVRLVRVVAGADGVDVVSPEGIHGGGHIGHADGPAGVRVPLVAVHPPEDQALPVEEEQAVSQLEAPEARVIGHHLCNAPVRSGDRQGHPVEGGVLVPPGTDVLEPEGRTDKVLPLTAELQCALKEVRSIRGLHPAADGRPRRLPLQQQPDAEGPRDAVRLQPRLEPEVRQVDLWLGVQEHGPEQAAETEEILVLDPGGAGALVDLHAQTVAGLADIGGQVEVRGGEAVLGIACEMAVDPYIDGLLRPLEADAHPLAPQALVQVELPDVAAHGVIVQVHLGRAELTAAVPGVEGIDILELSIALGLHVAGDQDDAEGAVVKALLPKVRRTLCRGLAPAEAPLPVQALPQGGGACADFLCRGIADVVGVGVQAVDLEHGGVR